MWIARLRPVAPKKKLYRVRFHNDGRVFEVYCRRVGQGELFGFVEIGDFAWGRKSDLIIDPTEQELRNEFADVSSAQIPMHAIVRVDEVERAGTSKVVRVATASAPPAEVSEGRILPVGLSLLVPRPPGSPRGR